jgi:hypothetical protein
MGLYLNSPNTPSWRGVQLKHRNNFAFTFDLLLHLVADIPFVGLTPGGQSGNFWIHPRMMTWKKVAVGYSKILLQNSTEETEKNHEDLQYIWTPVIRSRSDSSDVRCTWLPLSTIISCNGFSYRKIYAFRIDPKL